jgi:hypothetical protein
VGYTDWRAAATDFAQLIRRFRRPGKRQLQYEELRRDIDACLMMSGHLATPGSGGWSAQWAYLDKTLTEIGKRGISHASDWLDELRG